jgi:hypothetical protein
VDSTEFVSWEEFHIHFLLSQGFSAKEAEKGVDYESVDLDPDGKWENILNI